MSRISWGGAYLSIAVILVPFFPVFKLIGELAIETIHLISNLPIVVSARLFPCSSDMKKPN